MTASTCGSGVHSVKKKWRVNQHLGLLVGNGGLQGTCKQSQKCESCHMALSMKVQTVQYNSTLGCMSATGGCRAPRSKGRQTNHFK